MTAPLRVLFVCHRADLTGAPLCLRDLLAGLDRKTFEPHVLLGEDGALALQIRELGITPIVLERKSLRGIRGYAHLRKLIHEISPHVVQVSSAVALSKSAATVARLAGHPVVWYLHDHFGLEKFRRRRPWVRLLSSAIVACSQSIARDIPSRKTRWIPNGVRLADVAREEEVAHALDRLGIKPAEFFFVFIGSIMPHKNVHLIVEAARLVIEEFPNTRFLIKGGGEKPQYRDEVKELIARHDLGEHVFIFPESPDVRDFYRVADAVLLPSSHECFPRVVLEAAAHARATLATSVGDVEIMIEPQVSGWILGCKSLSERTLAEAMKSVRSLGREHAREVGMAARAKIAARFGLHAFQQSFERLWMSLARRDLASGVAVENE